MLMLVRRNRRRSALAAAVAAGSLLAAVVSAAPAAAIGDGFDPHAVPVTIPGTSTVVNEWKLAGQGFAQGVQIAPQWIMASGHAHPFLNSTFTNEYGSAVVDRIAGVCAVQGSGCDVSVAHLATPINAPSFPPLLLDGVPDQPGVTTAGNTLAVGNGGSTNGRPTVGWTQPTANGMTLPVLQSGLSGINGDSGGPAFYYYPGSTTGVLQGLNSVQSYGIVAGLQQFNSAKVKPFLDSVLPLGTVNWVTFSQLGPLPLVPEPVANPTVAAQPTGLRVTWPAVISNPPVTGYRAVLVRTDNVQSSMVFNTSPDHRAAVFTGLTAGVTYGVFVLASNANGESRVPFKGLSGVSVPPAPPIVFWNTVAAASLPPTGPASLTVATAPGLRLFLENIVPGDAQIAGVTTYEATVGQCNASPCSSAPTTQVADITFTLNGDTPSISLPANTPMGTQFQVQVTERNTAGVSAPLSQLVTYIPLAETLPPTSMTVTSQADGSTTVSFVPAPVDPEPGFLTGYTPHAPAESYVVELTTPALGTEVVDVLAPSQTTDSFNIADFDAPPGDYNVFVQALSSWGLSPRLSVTAAMGILPPPAPVTVTPTPAAPPAPANLNVPTVAAIGDANIVTWTQPAPGTGVAGVDQYLVTITDQDPASTVPPIAAVVPASQLSYSFQVPFANQYTVNVYAFSQQAGASAPATATGFNENHES
jgi:hypothetical protein